MLYGLGNYPAQQRGVGDRDHVSYKHPSLTNTLLFRGHPPPPPSFRIFNQNAFLNPTPHQIFTECNSNPPKQNILGFLFRLLVKNGGESVYVFLFTVSKRATQSQKRRGKIIKMKFASGGLETKLLAAWGIFFITQGTRSLLFFRHTCS